MEYMLWMLTNWIIMQNLVHSRKLNLLEIY